MITIVDYGAGNIKSIQNMLRRLGVDSIISNMPSEILKAEKLILPGVGHFDYGMKNLKSSGLIDVLYQAAIKNKVPFLGICLGAQLLGNKSEEGVENGLGWIDMDIVKFDVTRIDAKFKIPHMGWNEIEINQKSPLLTNLDTASRFYFVHTYHMDPKSKTDILATTHYGYDFVSAVRRENVYGVQFHPEKSHKYGMQLLTNFSNL
jgi:glutamine amidotransferase